MKKTAALKLKPPLSKRIKICLLYDGFFSFAVVRQISFVIKEKADNKQFQSSACYRLCVWLFDNGHIQFSNTD
jgi:hypothetical protein